MAATRSLFGKPAGRCRAPDRSRSRRRDGSVRCAAMPASRPLLPRGGPMRPEHSRSRTANSDNVDRLSAISTIDTPKSASSEARRRPDGGSSSPRRSHGLSRRPWFAGQHPRERLGEFVEQILKRTCQHRRSCDQHIIIPRGRHARQQPARRGDQTTLGAIARHRIADTPAGGETDADRRGSALRRRRARSDLQHETRSDPSPAARRDGKKFRTTLEPRHPTRRVLAGGRSSIALAPAPLRRTDACVPWPADGRAPGGRRRSPRGHESHGAACG